MYELFFANHEDQIDYVQEVYCSFESYDELLQDQKLLEQWQSFLSGEESLYSAQEWTIFFFYLSQFVCPLETIEFTFIDFEYGEYKTSFNENKARLKLFLNAIKPSYPDIKDVGKPRKRIPDTKTGYRQYSASYNPKYQQFPMTNGVVYQPFILLDSGAYTDTSKGKRISPEDALNRMLQWEEKASKLWGFKVVANYFASYDCLPLGDFAEDCDRISLESAEYLNSQRAKLGSRQLIFTAQGNTVDKQIQSMLDISLLLQQGDVLGIGGYANLGKCKSRLPDFKIIMEEAKRICDERNIENIHIWGVRWQKGTELIKEIFRNSNINISCDTSAPYQLWTRAKDNTSLIKGGAKSTSFPEHCSIIQTQLAL